MRPSSTPTVSIVLPRHLLPVLFPFLSSGFEVPISRSLSIKDFLCKELILDPDYVESRIQTVFLNGRAVDDLDQAILVAGSTLALSAAMPGLVGACFRRGGRYSGFRGNVSLIKATTNGPERHEKQGRVTLKLFNLIVAEVGPTLLNQGIILSTKALTEVINVLIASAEAAMEFHLYDQPVIPAELCSRLFGLEEILLRIRPVDG